MNHQSIKPIFDSKSLVESNPNYISGKTYNIVVIGHGDVTEKLKNLQDNFSFSLRLTDMEQANFVINRSTIAIVFDEEELKMTTPTRMNDILVLYGDIPKYFLSRTKRSSHFYSNLYSKGIRGIIAWPREMELFPEIIVESLRLRNESEGDSEADKRLAQIIKSHIKIVSPSTEVIVKCKDGFVFLNGHTKNLNEYEIVIKEVQSVLGVKKTIAKNLTVEYIDRIDENRLRSMIDLYTMNMAQGNVDLRYELKDRTLTMEGSIDNYEDQMNIESIIKRFRGIEKIKKDIVFTGEIKFSVKKLEKEIETMLKITFDDVHSLNVMIFSKVIELEGVVGSYATREFIEQWVLEVYAFEKVVNKLMVRI